VTLSSVWGLWNIPFALPLGSHLTDGSISHTSAKLLALGAPAQAADLSLQRAAQLPLLKVRHVQVSVTSHDGTELGFLSGRVRY
jgi:hypothetical protein